MPLDEYRRKRDFTRTPEPSGDAGAVPPPGPGPESHPAFPGWANLPEGRRFCVQMHRATRLHFDLRLEHSGVLLSWAVPRGPSLDPRLKRMAVHVEDHPLEYGDFEGIIPSGYGMGVVELWDAGTFAWIKETAADPDGSLRKGDVKFELHGVKLRGEFVLVHTGGRRGDPGDDRNWLVIKKRDDHVIDDWEAVGNDWSVKTGRTLDRIAEEGGGDPRKRAKVRRGVPVGAGPAGRPVMPATVRPMLAVTVDTPFSSPDWMFELKYDGVRAIFRVAGGEVTVRGRSGRDETARYPEAHRLLAALNGVDALVDGEIVALDGQGIPTFERLQRRINVSRPRDIERVAREVPVTVVAFDLLFAGGDDLRDHPLQRRKQRLRELLRDTPGVLYAADVVGDGEAFFEAVQQRGLEGMVAKRLDSPYREGERSPSWAKCKAWLTQDAVICGFTQGRGGRGKLGSLVLGVCDDGKLVHAGKVGSGLDDAALRDLLRRLGRSVVVRPAIAPPATADMPVTWVSPDLVCEVRHGGWTNAGTMRHPTFRGMRPDVAPADCVRERALPVPPQIAAAPGPPVALPPIAAVPPPPAARPPIAAALRPPTVPPRIAAAPLPVAHLSVPGDADGAVADVLAQLAVIGPRGGALSIDGRSVRITNPDKVFWPESGYTKRDLIAHAIRVAPLMLPYLRDRPIGMQMFPDGITGKSFWRKERPPHTPEWIRTWEHDHGRATTTYIVADTMATLAFVANLGAIDIHPWHSRIDRPDLPDWAVFDLDPFAPMTFAEVVEIARLVRASLDFYGLSSVLKTSGQTGLQIYVPLRRGPSYEAVRGWVEEVARAITRIVPDKITWEWEVARRTGKLRIDYTQNILNKTLAAPYSLRPAPGAPVSAPITWEELDDPELRPDRWNVQTIERRVAEVGDLFSPLLEQHQELPAAPIPGAGERRSSEDRRNL